MVHITTFFLFLKKKNMSKKILGLDIGTTSIGWAIVEATDEKKINEYTNEFATTDINNDRIGIYKDAIGVRIISQDTSSVQSFNKGQKLTSATTSTPTANRRKKRGMRRLKSRYKLRRGKLHNVLDKLNMLPDGINKIQNIKGKMEFIQNENGKYYTAQKGKRENNDIGKVIYELRDRAIREKISLQEFGRILLHLNQWRGYSSDRFVVTEKEETSVGTTARVEKIEKSDDYVFKKKKGGKEIETIYNTYIIYFDNGESGIVVRTKENENADFIIGKLCTYKFKDEHEINGVKQIDKKNLNENSWVFKKDKINTSIAEWCNSGGTLGSYLYHNFYENNNIDRIRNNVVDRDWYENEFDKIWNFQYENNKDFFEKINIDEIVKIAFKDYQAVLNEVKKKNGIKEQLRCLIKDKIIFYQRPWQQAKNKGQCPFEKKIVKKEQTIKGTGEKKIVDLHIGRTVIPRSHPLFQEFKIWQQINNVRIFLNRPAEKIDLFADAVLFYKYVGKAIAEVKQMLYDALQESKTLSWRTFVKDQLKLNTFEDLESSKSSKNKTENKGIDTETGEIVKTYFSVNFRKPKKDRTWEDIKLKGNTTKVSLQKILTDKTEEWFNSIYKKSNDNHNNTKSEIGKYNYKDCEYIVTNFQLLWETIYDITILDEKKLKENIKNKFPNNIFTDEQLNALSKLKFEDAGMGNLSAKAIRQILPLMSNGNNLTLKASDKIKSLIDLNNSEEEKIKNNDEKLEGLKSFITDKKARVRLSQFKNKNDFTYLNYWEAIAVVYGSHSTKNTIIKTEISRVENHSMNNPVVEKIVNETISIVNDIYKIYGFDEVRIELSRELKASMEERQHMDEAMRSNGKRNELAKRMLRELFNADNSINNIDKLKIYEDEAKQMTKERYDKLKEKGKINKETNFEKFEDIAKELNLKEPSKADIRRYRLWLDQMCQCPYTGEIIKLSDVFTDKYEVEHIIPKARYLDNSYSNKVITRKVINKWKKDRLAYEFIIQEGGKEITDNIDNKPLEILKLDDKTNEGTYKNLVTELFKGRKLQNLLRKVPPEDPINRELKDTQYITKKLKEKLAELVGENKVWTTTGSVTDILRESWHLNDVMKELINERYNSFKVGMGQGSEPLNLAIEYEVESIKNGVNKKTTVYPAFSKRLDHRHHIIDAFIIACTKQWHIQYINTMNAANSIDLSIDNVDKIKAIKLKQLVCKQSIEGDYKSYDFDYPWKNYNKSLILDKLTTVFIAHKNIQLLSTPSKHNKKKNGVVIEVLENGLPQKPISIRGSLHEDTFIGERKIYSSNTKTIEQIIDEIFEKRKKSSEQLKKVYQFNELIKRIVFKKEYQDQLVYLFNLFKSENIHDSALKEKVVKYLIEHKKYFFNYATLNEIRYVNRGTDKEGTIDKVSTDKIVDNRIKKIMEYREEFIGILEKNRKSLNINLVDEKRELELKIKNAKNYLNFPIYYNAIYLVRIIDSNKQICWIKLHNLKNEDIDKIYYSKGNKADLKRTNEVKNLLKNKLLFYQNNLEEVFFNPLFAESQKNKKIPIKKISQFNKNNNALYEIRPNTFVVLGNNFMTYVFEDANKKKVFKFLSFMNAITRKTENKTLKNENLYPLELVEEGLIQKFTLVKNELVVIPNSNEEIDFNDFNQVSNRLYIVNSFSESDGFVLFEKHSAAFNIKLKQHIDSPKLILEFENLKVNVDKEIQLENQKLNDFEISKTQRKEIENKIISLQKLPDKFLKTISNKDGIEENTILKSKDAMQSCIKVFTDKLGKKIVPYWEFKNGCWDKERAIELGLILK